MSYKTETAANNLASMLEEYKTKLDGFEKRRQSELEAARYDHRDTPDENMKISARVDAERDIYAEQAKKQASDAISSMLEEETNAAAERKAEAARRAKTIYNTPSHQAAVGNALKMMEMLGGDMTAEQLQMIVDPFVEEGDCNSLTLLSAIAHKTSPSLFLMSNRVNFGSLPDDSLEFAKSLTGIIEKGFNDPDKAPLRAAYARGMITRRFHPENNDSNFGQLVDPE